MNLNDPILPAGLRDAGIEIYHHKGDLFCVYQGKQYLFEELPEDLHEIIEIQLINDPVALNSLETDMGILDSNEMLRQFVLCNYGGFDMSPDLTKEGKSELEFWDCGRRGKCPGEGRVCKLPTGPGGALTPRELMVVRWVAKGLPDKLIAQRMDITINSVKTYLCRIRAKIHAYNRIDIMRFAMKFDLHK